MKQKKQITIMIAGGAGYWAELNHYPAIMQLKKEKFPVAITAIIDPRNPGKLSNRANLQTVLQSDNPTWINPEGKSVQELEEEMNTFIQKQCVDLLIVSTDPVYHPFYCEWGMKHDIHVICDKPIVVTKNAASEATAASTIQKEYERLEKLYREKKKANKNYLFITPLRRRVLTPFRRIADELESVYTKTGEGIRYMSVNVNGGLHRYPVEFLKGGAHGYINGVGSLAHSSYHYIDTIAWYLQIARGNAVTLSLTLPYVARVNDYVKTKQYRVLKELIESKNNAISDRLTLPQNVLAAELDFMVHIRLLDKQNSSLGLITYSANHTTYSPRVAQYDPDVLDHANEKGGGRMSQIYMDIHQGAVQNWQLLKNDIVSTGENISITGRKHPYIGDVYIEEKYTNAYETGTGPKDIVQNVIKYIAGENVDTTSFSIVSTFETQKLTNRLFSAFYELIAKEYNSKKHGSSAIEETIDLTKYI